MHKPLFDRIAILGLGLIGSSLARAIADKKLAQHIAAFDISADSTSYASEQGFIQSHHAHPGEAVKDAELIIFASPPSTFASLARDIAPFINKAAIITDTASVKRSAIAAIAPALPDYSFFVPGHPIAGSEKTGVHAGRADLFLGKRMILTPDEKDVTSQPVAKVRALWEAVDAKIEYMPADLHDHIYAYVSHLPQLIAYAAWADAKASGAGIARLAQSDVNLWADICSMNADFIVRALTDFADFSAQIAGELAENNGESHGDSAKADVLFPKVIATCLVATVSLLQERTGVHPARFAGTGFADMTAPAVDDPEAALASISEHHKLIAQKLKTTLARVHAIKNALETQDRAKLVTLLQEAKK